MDAFTSTFHQYIATFSFNSTFVLIILIFMVIGAIDWLRGNKLGYGAKFEEGFVILGNFFMVMIGLFAMIPVFLELFQGVITNIFSFLGFDPAMFAGMILANDMGAYPLAVELAGTPAAASFASLIIGSILGVNIVWSIPIGMQYVKGDDVRYMAQGFLIGLSTIPIGAIIGGIAMNLFGYEISISTVLYNSIPIAVMSLLIMLGFIFIQDSMIACFTRFTKIINVIVIAGIILSLTQYLTGIRLPLFHVMVEPDSTGAIPILNAVTIIGGVGFILIGAFPMMEFITRKFNKPLTIAGAKIGINEASVAGIVACTANNMLMLGMYRDMNPKGKVLAAAFCTSGAFILGDHLAFTASIDKGMIVPVFLAKLFGCATAITLALLLWNRINKKGAA